MFLRSLALEPLGIDLLPALGLKQDHEQVYMREQADVREGKEVLIHRQDLPDAMLCLIFLSLNCFIVPLVLFILHVIICLLRLLLTNATVQKLSFLFPPGAGTAPGTAKAFSEED